MPTFYFHIRRGDAVYEDREGYDAANVAAAVRHAIEDARAIIRDEPEVPRAIQWVEVADDHGNTIRTVPFETLKGNSPTT